MMKIETRESDGHLVLKVEGRLAGAFVPELEHCWQSAEAEQPERKIALDLKGVTCVDRSGRRLLQAMREHGVELLRAGMTIQDLLDCRF